MSCYKSCNFKFLYSKKLRIYILRQVLVMAPTREIAVQGVTVAQQIGQQLSQVKVQAFIGGLTLAEDKIR